MAFFSTPPRSTIFPFPAWLAPPSNPPPGRSRQLATIVPPPSTIFTYQYYKRADDATNIGSTPNATTLGAAVTTTTAAKSGLTLPISKTLFYRSAWPQVFLQVESPTSPGTYINFP